MKNEAAKVNKGTHNVSLGTAAARLNLHLLYRSQWSNNSSPRLRLCLQKSTWAFFCTLFHARKSVDWANHSEYRCTIQNQHKPMKKQIKQKNKAEYKQTTNPLPNGTTKDCAQQSCKTCEIISVMQHAGELAATHN